jgi:hypothetical protein
MRLFSMSIAQTRLSPLVVKKIIPREGTLPAVGTVRSGSGIS